MTGAAHESMDDDFIYRKKAFYTGPQNYLLFFSLSGTGDASPLL